MHFYESSIITTKDGLHCQVYGNEHPVDRIIVKPKYIPTEKIKCDSLQYRFISGKKMNRLNMWIDKKELKCYIEEFKKKYPQYIFSSDMHDKDRLFFAIPIEDVERVYFPRRGLSELMKMPKDALDDHLELVQNLIDFLLASGLRVKDLGITYSTLMGHYLSKISDINVVVYGKTNFWNLMKYLEVAKHPLLKWKTKENWLDFRKRRNRAKLFTEDEFVHLMSRKRSEGYFENTLFVIFCAEKEEEIWFKWGDEKYSAVGSVTIEGKVTNDFSSVVRPGCYEINDSKIIEGHEDVPVKRVVFYSRDYAMLAHPREKIRASGILEKVKTKDGKEYYRVVVGYFDAYLCDRREKEYIKVIK